jgi:hypothetical protein
MLSDEEIFFMYGKSAVISRKGSFTLVHLDRPSAELIRCRTEEFDPDDYFEDDCPLCRMLRNGGIIIFDEGFYEDEEILLE